MSRFMPRHRRNEERNQRIGIALVVLVLGGLFIGSCNYASSTAITRIRVTGTERTGGENSKWLVLTETETFENTDSLWHGKFNSSDLQGKFKPGYEYTVEVYGARIPFLSVYRNITRIVSSRKLDE